MKHVQRLTQSITQLIVAFISLFAVPYGLAQLALWLGIWQAIDRLYPTDMRAFWACMIASRVSFAVIWIVITAVIIAVGSVTEFFWFPPPTGERKPDYTLEKTEHRDQSRVIVLIIVIVAIVLWFSEVAIRFYTGLPTIGM